MMTEHSEILMTYNKCVQTTISVKAYNIGDTEERLGLQLKTSRLFPCYSIPMRDYLTNLGIRYELVGLHPVTYNMFWVYVKDDKLSEALKNWSK